MSLADAHRLVTRSMPHWRAAVFAAIALVSTITVAKAETVADPAAFISKIVTVTLEDLTASDIDDTERALRFRRIIDDTFAVGLAGKWILGPYWRQASEPQRAEFLALLKNRMVSQNVAHFKRFKADDVVFELIKTQNVGENDYLVRTRIGGANGGKPVAMDWRVIRRNGRLWVFDVMVEGMSMGMAHKEEYQSVIRRNDGNIDGLLMALRQ